MFQGVCPTCWNPIPHMQKYPGVMHVCPCRTAFKHGTMEEYTQHEILCTNNTGSIEPEHSLISNRLVVVQYKANIQAVNRSWMLRSSRN